MATDATLTLSDTNSGFVVNFKKYEIPEWVKFGGPSNMAVHKQPGGTRQIDSMGPDDGPIHWDGIMLTADGATRIDDLWQMFKAGNKCTVEFGIWQFDVVISDLKLNYKAKNYCEYAIELTRVIGAEQAIGPGRFTTDLNLQGGLNTANDIA